PRAWVAMKLMCSAVTRSAAMARSPSFSRSSSSTMITNLPSRMSTMASSMRASGTALLLHRPGWDRRGGVGGQPAFDVLGEQVGLEVDTRAITPALRGGDREGMGDERHGEPVVQRLDHGQADAVDGDTAAGDDVAAHAV